MPHREASSRRRERIPKACNLRWRARSNLRNCPLVGDGQQVPRSYASGQELSLQDSQHCRITAESMQ